MTTNNDKILKALKTTKELITTTELANKTGIDIRNITRYLKPLEDKGIITRDTIQNGKIRVVKVGLSKEKPHLPVAPRPMPKLQPPKEVQVNIQDKKITPGEKDQSVAPKKKSDKLHILTKENLIHFIQEEKRTKLYEMRIRFYKNSLNEIDILIKKLFQENKLTKNKNGWISLKR